LLDQPFFDVLEHLSFSMQEVFSRFRLYGLRPGLDRYNEVCRK
jgi:hypothetical protein